MWQSRPHSKTPVPRTTVVRASKLRPPGIHTPVCLVVDFPDDDRISYDFDGYCGFEVPGAISGGTSGLVRRVSRYARMSWISSRVICASGIGMCGSMSVLLIRSDDWPGRLAIPRNVLIPSGADFPEPSTRWQLAQRRTASARPRAAEGSVDCAPTSVDASETDDMSAVAQRSPLHRLVHMSTIPQVWIEG